MGRTLKDDLADDMARSFFNTNEFAETVTLERRNRESTSIRIIVDDSGDIREDMHGREYVRELVVSLPRNTTIGVLSLETGDSFVWSVDGERYAFTGEIIEADPYLLKARFGRRYSTMVGGQMRNGPG